MDIVAKDKVYKEKANNYKTVLTITDTATGKKLGGKDYNTKLKYYYDHDTIVEVKQKKEIISVERAKDTEVQKEDIIPAGTTLRIETDAMNSYYGKVVARYNITSSDFTKAKVTIRNKEYTGHPVTITQEDVLSIKVGGVELDRSEYRIVDCINNTNKGKATVILEGLGNYGGRKSVTFKIEQKNMYFNLFRM